MMTKTNKCGGPSSKISIFGISLIINNAVLVRSCQLDQSLNKPDGYSDNSYAVWFRLETRLGSAYTSAKPFVPHRTGEYQAPDQAQLQQPALQDTCEIDGTEGSIITVIVMSVRWNRKDYNYLWRRTWSLGWRISLLSSISIYTVMSFYVHHLRLKCLRLPTGWSQLCTGSTDVSSCCRGGSAMRISCMAIAAASVWACCLVGPRPLNSKTRRPPSIAMMS